MIPLFSCTWWREGGTFTSNTPCGIFFVKKEKRWVLGSSNTTHSRSHGFPYVREGEREKERDSEGGSTIREKIEERKGSSFCDCCTRWHEQRKWIGLWLNVREQETVQTTDCVSIDPQRWRSCWRGDSSGGSTMPSTTALASDSASSSLLFISSSLPNESTLTDTLQDGLSLPEHPVSPTSIYAAIMRGKTWDSIAQEFHTTNLWVISSRMPNSPRFANISRRNDAAVSPSFWWITSSHFQWRNWAITISYM